MDRRQYLLGLATTTTVVVAGCTGEEEEEPEVVDDGNGNGDTGDDGNGNSNGSGNGATGSDGDGNDGTGDSDGGDGQAAEDVEAVVGALIDGGDMQLVVEGIERGAEFGEFVEPEAGNEFVAITIALKNVSDEFVHVSNLLQTRIRDDEDYSYDQTFVAGNQPTFNDGQFAPGEVERGILPFEIPEDATGLRLVWDFDVGLFEDVNRATIDLEETTDVRRLEQNLQIDVHDVGTTIEFGDVQVTVNEMRVEEALGEFTEPEPGNEYVIVDISIANNTGEDERVSTILQMLAKDGDGWSYQEDFTASAQLDRPFDEGSPIADGDTRRGEVIYEVEQGLSPLYWVFEFSLWTEGDKTFWQLR
jgi:hypothetical protein